MPLFCSIVLPVYNEEGNLEELYYRITKVMKKIDKPYEIIFVNDGSTDSSLEKMTSLHNQDKRVKILNLSRNFGHQIAITAGMDYAKGEVIIIMDADLQDPPEVIPRLLQEWEKGFDVVYAKRKGREGESFFKKFTAWLYYRLFRILANLDIPVDTGDFRLLSRRVVEVLKQIREHHRFLRGLVTWIGFKQCGVEFVREKRFSGKTKYSFWKMMKFALDGILSFSFFPLRLLTYLGFLTAFFSLLYAGYVIFLKIFTQATVPGWASLMVAILFLGSLQLIGLGIIGEYLGRIGDEVKKRPLYIVKEFIE